VKGKGKCCKGKEKEKKTRKELVAEALKNAYFSSDQERSECVNIYTNAKLTIEEILMITAPLRDMTSNLKHNHHRVMGIGGIY
jgi:hypothetical protein